MPQKPTVSDEINQFLSTFPTSTATSSGLPPIGVPATMNVDGKEVPFTAHQPAPPHGGALHHFHNPFSNVGAQHGVDVPVQYFEGDEWSPANSSPEDIARVQQQMVDAGLIPKGAAYHPGVWDDTTRQAFRDVLAYANATGFNADMALKTLVTHPAAKAPAAAYLQPDIASVAQTVKETVAKKLGRDATPEEVRHLSEIMMGVDRKAYEAGTAADAASSAATVKNVDPAAELAQYLDTTYAPEIQRTKGVVDLSQSRENLMSNIFALDKSIQG